MLNVCFSESAHGILTHAVHDGYLIDSKTVCIPDDLSLGDISNPRNLDTRMKILLALYSDREYVDQTCKKLYQQFYDQIFAHEKIMIWYANTPAEYCGLLYTLWLLKESPAAVGTVCCSRTLKRGENQFASYYSVSDLKPEEVIRFLPFETSLTAQERKEHAFEWEKLADENGQLRVYWNETVQTADLSYYDDAILKYVGAKPQTVADTVRNFIREEQPGVNERLVIARINALIRKGILQSDGDSVSYRDMITLIRPEQNRRILSIEQQIAARKAKI